MMRHVWLPGFSFSTLGLVEKGLMKETVAWLTLKLVVQRKEMFFWEHKIGGPESQRRHS